MTLPDNHDVPEPLVLYKYMSGNRALAVLPENGNGTLRATQPASLNDPLECATICAAVYPNKNEEAHEMVRALNSIVPEHPVDAGAVQTSLRQLGSQAWNDLFRKQLSRRVGVVSFGSSALHPLMWAHYADSGAGVVVGYRLSTLRTIARGHERLEPVRYMDQPPLTAGHVIFKDEGNLHAILLTKAQYWEYEREWRLTLELRNTVGTGETDQRGYSINLCAIPNEAVTEVYFTERTPSPTVDTIAARLRDPNNRFGAEEPRKVVLASNKYGYTV